MKVLGVNFFLKHSVESAVDGHYLHLQTQFGEDRCTQFRVIVVTDPQTNKPTNKHKESDIHKQAGPITIHCATKLSAQCN